MNASQARVALAGCGLAALLVVGAAGCVTQSESKQPPDEVKHVEPVMEPKAGPALQVPTQPKPAPADAKTAPEKKPGEK